MQAPPEPGVRYEGRRQEVRESQLKVSGPLGVLLNQKESLGHPDNNNIDVYEKESAAFPTVTLL